jgi:hypothetical protein
MSATAFESSALTTIQFTSEALVFANVPHVSSDSFEDLALKERPIGVIHFVKQFRHCNQKLDLDCVSGRSYAFNPRNI